MTVVRAGRCQCGEVRFQVSGEPVRVGVCHCTDCRQTSGSAFTFFAIWGRKAFKVDGQIATYKGRSFCPNCGSRTFALTADEAEIMCGALDDAPTDLVPSYELWIPRREEWMMHLPWADQFTGDRNVPSSSQAPSDAPKKL